MAKNENPGEMPGTDGTSGNDGNDELTFEGWFESQDETVKALLDGHTSSLKTALTDERTQRKELAKALKDATKELDEGTKARDALEALSGKLEATEQRLAFTESVAGQVTNVKLAWIAANDCGALDKSGAVNLDTLKASYPELFTTKRQPVGNAGNGTGDSGVPSGKDMNAFIRAAAGRQ